MSQRVFVTGMGIMSSIGENVEETLKSLKASRSGIGPIHHLKTIHKDLFVAGEINRSLKDLRDLAGVQSDSFTRGTLLGMLAAKEALSSSGIDLTETTTTTGLISSTSVAGMSRTELYYKELFEKNDHIDCIDTHDCGDSTSRIAEYLGIHSFLTTISTACSSAANAIMLGARMIKSGQLGRVVAGGTDALSAFTLNGFNTLMILDKQWCSPFDEERRGLNLGEGAAYLVLESEEEVKRTGKKVLAELSGYGNANDAYHQTASSPEGLGATLSISKALKVAGLSPSEIDYINVHGTGTANNDLSEGIALINIFADSIPKFSSTKAFTGHTLAPAGSIEAVISILSMQQETIFPNLNFSKPMKEFNLIPVTELTEGVRLNHILSNSFGFGGNCSSLIFSKYGA